MQRQLRVMVLDTSPTSRKILEVILVREGHQVVCFDDSLEARRFLSRHGPADLLLLGLYPPRSDGFALLKYLKGEPRFRSMVPVALLSERDGVLGRLMARLAGAQQVVAKPLVRQRIVALLSEYALQRDSTRAEDERAGSQALDNDEAAFSLERNDEPGETASSPTV